MSDSRKLTLIYTDCGAKKGGDFASTAQIAHMIQSHYTASVAGNYCILASSEDGVEKYRAMYGAEACDDQHVNLFGISIKVQSLAQFIGSQDRAFLVNYVEVAACDPAPTNLVKQLLMQPDVSATFIGLPHNSIFNFRMLYTYQYGAGVNVLHTGFGPQRHGIPMQFGDTLTIDHSATNNITEGSYGFVYFNEHGNNPANFVMDYVRTANKAFDTTNFVIVGHAKQTVEALKTCAMKLKKPIFVIDHDNNKIHTIEYDDKKSMLVSSSRDIKEDEEIELPADAIHVSLHKGVPSKQMHALMRDAIDFVAVTGVASMAESLAFNKVSLYQFMSNNEIFSDSYVMAVYKRLSGSDQQKAKDMLPLLIWSDKFSASEFKQLRGLLKDDAFRGAFIAANASLMESCTLLETLKQHLTMKPGAVAAKAESDHSAPQLSAATHAGKQKATLFTPVDDETLGETKEKKAKAPKAKSGMGHK